MQPEEHARLYDLYRAMRDEELENVAVEAYDLTDVAQQCLRDEIRSRGLGIELNMDRPPDEDEEALPPTDDGFIPDDHDLVTVEWAEDMNQLLRVKSALDAAKIECFFGDQKTRNPKELPADFAGGVRIFVWQAAFREAENVLRAATPGYGEVKNEDIADAEVRCPKCHSDGVIFEELDSATGNTLRDFKYKWRCDDCGYEWEDDGVVSAEQ